MKKVWLAFHITSLILAVMFLNYFLFNDIEISVTFFILCIYVIARSVYGIIEEL